ncbi:hypothetical protein XELAEV_18024038mg [Xenopus laevis]|uniref:Uncharacterized protein n=1 Tax=Xenopus laevis TaxID=8355 RepID=A0A974D586_XENLA|nr:hypothetical protein XELAEV_18024038mg [Xenopus laevis]
MTSNFDLNLLAHPHQYYVLCCRYLGTNNGGWHNMINMPAVHQMGHSGERFNLTIIKTCHHIIMRCESSLYQL